MSRSNFGVFCGRTRPDKYSTNPQGEPMWSQLTVAEQSSHTERRNDILPLSWAWGLGPRLLSIKILFWERKMAMVSDGVLVQTSSLQTRRQYQMFIFASWSGWRSVQPTTHFHYRRKFNNDKDPAFREPGKYLDISLFSFKQSHIPTAKILILTSFLLSPTPKIVWTCRNFTCRNFTRHRRVKPLRAAQKNRSPNLLQIIEAKMPWPTSTTSTVFQSRTLRRSGGLKMDPWIFHIQIRLSKR